MSTKFNINLSRGSSVNDQIFGLINGYTDNSIEFLQKKNINIENFQLINSDTGTVTNIESQFNKKEFNIKNNYTYKEIGSTHFSFNGFKIANNPPYVENRTNEINLKLNVLLNSKLSFSYNDNYHNNKISGPSNILKEFQLNDYYKMFFLDQLVEGGTTFGFPMILSHLLLISKSQSLDLNMSNLYHKSLLKSSEYFIYEDMLFKIFSTLYTSNDTRRQNIINYIINIDTTTPSPPHCIFQSYLRNWEPELDTLTYIPINTNSHSTLLTIKKNSSGTFDIYHMNTGNGTNFVEEDNLKDFEIKCKGIFKLEGITKENIIVFLKQYLIFKVLLYFKSTSFKSSISVIYFMLLNLKQKQESYLNQITDNSQPSRDFSDFIYEIDNLHAIDFKEIMVIPENNLFELNKQVDGVCYFRTINYTYLLFLIVNNTTGQSMENILKNYFTYFTNIYNKNFEKYYDFLIENLGIINSQERKNLGNTLINLLNFYKINSDGSKNSEIETNISRFRVKINSKTIDSTSNSFDTLNNTFNNQIIYAKTNTYMILEINKIFPISEDIEAIFMSELDDTGTYKADTYGYINNTIDYIITSAYECNLLSYKYYSRILLNLCLNSSKFGEDQLELLKFFIKKIDYSISMSIEPFNFTNDDSLEEVSELTYCKTILFTYYLKY